MTRGDRIAVLGGGIGGLASAYELLQLGAQPVLFEAADHFGGLGAAFTHDGVNLDRFYHVMLDSDAELCALISAMGLTDRVAWRETGMGFYIGGALYPFNTPGDLLRFRALPALARLRTGAGALYMTRLKRRPGRLDELHAAEWLRRLFGPHVARAIWEPLLRAKFGDAGGSVPAYWVWTLLRREKNGSQEVKGYLRGGFHTLATALVSHTRARGATLRLRTPVRRLEADSDGVTIESDAAGRERFAAAISTLPLPQLAAVAAGPLRQALPQPNLGYQGVVNVLLLLRRPLERFYWTVVVDPQLPFQGVVETTHVLPPEWVGGRHLVYLLAYCPAGSAQYTRPDALLKEQAVAMLETMYPSFQRDTVEAAFVGRAPYVEPVWPTGYLASRPAHRVGETRLYLSTTAQAYPRVTAWNTSIALAAETVGALATDGWVGAGPSMHQQYRTVA
jgi:protoporphyrinogen oxidase